MKAGKFINCVSCWKIYDRQESRVINKSITTLASSLSLSRTFFRANKSLRQPHFHRLTLVGLVFSGVDVL